MKHKYINLIISNHTNNKMNSNIISNIKQIYSHAKLGNGNKIVVARLTADLKEELFTSVSVSVNGEASRRSKTTNVTVDKYYIVVYVGETANQKFNMVLDTLNNVREVRKFKLTEKTVNEIRITEDAKHIEVISGKDNVVHVYGLFN